MISDFEFSMSDFVKLLNTTGELLLISIYKIKLQKFQSK